MHKAFYVVLVHYVVYKLGQFHIALRGYFLNNTPRLACTSRKELSTNRTFRKSLTTTTAGHFGVTVPTTDYVANINGFKANATSLLTHLLLHFLKQFN